MIKETTKVLINSLIGQSKVDSYEQRNKHVIAHVTPAGKFRGELSATINLWVLS